MNNLVLTGEGKVKYIENRDLFENAKTIFDTRTDNEERTEWLNNRKSTIGGSEIGAIAGFSNYASALTVFNDKKGLVEPFKGNIHTKFGNRMENHIREWVQEDFKEETGITLTTYEYPFMMIDKQYEYMSANIDGLGILDKEFVYQENLDTGEVAAIPENELFGLEIKTGSEFLKKMWDGEEVPSTYYLQCQWYMGITGLKHFLIIYLLGKEIKWKVIPRCDEDIEAIRDLAKDFYENNLLKDIPPAPTGLVKETKEIQEQQSLVDDDITIVSNNLIEYQTISAKIKELEKEKERLKQELFLEMGNSKKGSDGHFKVSRYEVSGRETINTKAFKEKYPETYKSCVELGIAKKGSSYVNMKVSAMK